MGKLKPPTNVLFVCSRNKWRSLTAERIFSHLPGYAVESAGTEAAARIKVTEGHIRRADLIFAMERRHVRRLRDRFGEALAGKKLVCLHIPDDFQFMDPDLVELLKVRAGPHLGLSE
jgi:predicted protein tyrosine phosphatase